MPPRSVLLSLASAYFVLGVSSLAVVGLVPPIANDLHVAPASVALLVTAFALTYAVVSPLSQMVIGHWERRSLILTGLGLMAAGLLGSGLAPDYPTLFVARMVMAAGAVLIGPMASATAASLSRPEERGAALGAVFGGMTLATVIGVPASGWMGSFVGWRETMGVLAVVAVAAAVWVRLAVPGASRGQRSSLADMREILGDRIVASAIGVAMFQMAAQFATYALIGAYLTEVFRMPASWVPLGLAIFGIGGVVGNAMASRLMLKVAPVRMVGIGLVALGACMAAFLVAPPWAWLALLLMLLWAISGMSPIAAGQAWLLQLAPGNLVLALNAAAMYVGIAGGSALSGLTYTLAGAAALPLASLLTVGIAGLCYRIARRG
ncbi:MFS transporter [Roseococcus sp. YIM B11640]|uniref:MFS transporter n=1 Tax=Roseococcus sp. YIM B11640 TaxID=3133973 RepID=UPI003C7CD720